MLVIPFEMWGILTGWGQNEVALPRGKYGIGGGRKCRGAPAINALGETVEAFIGGSSLVEMKEEL